MTNHKLLLVAAIFSLSSQVVFAETPRADFAKGIIQSALQTDWNYEKSYLRVLCADFRKTLSKPGFVKQNKAMEEQWQNGRQYGKTIKVLSVKDSMKKFSMGYQVDVKAKNEETEKEANFRFWIREDSSEGLCLGGFNFY